jgi:ACS family tartrate transporter-like MFS transporter
MKPLYKKIAWRLIPFLVLLYAVAFLDRVNISFAALTMNRDLGISDSFYGFAAGVFFLGYCLFEVPANMALARVGARRWLALLQVVWGLVSVGTAFVPGKGEYVAARCVLGVVEAGFFPGVIYYLTLWLPRPMRTRMMALFLLALPLCNSFGSPISAHILLLDHVGGLKGWQWLFILEGSPAILLGMATFFVLVDNPWSARWLSESEKDELAREMHADEAIERPGDGNIHLHVIRSSIAYFMLNVGLYGLTFWLPKMLVASGMTATATGWWAVLPYGTGAVAMWMGSRRSGRGWLATLFIVSAAGFVLAGLIPGLTASIAGFCVAAMGGYAAVALFWSACTGRMSGKVAGAAIATVNSLGVLGGFVGPYAIGWLRDATHSYTVGLLGTAACLVLGAVATLSGEADIRTADAKQPMRSG